MSPRKKKKNENEDEKIQEMKAELAEVDDSDRILKQTGVIDIEMLLDVLGNDVDRKILMKLSKVPRYASDLAIDIGISKPAIKKHIDKLMEQGIILPHSRGKKGRRKALYYCINPNLGLTLRLDLSNNFFHYRVENTGSYTRDLSDKMEMERRDKALSQIQVSLADPELETFLSKKTSPRPEAERKKKAEMRKRLADVEQINQSLKQLGKALRSVESEIKKVERKRLELVLKKNELIGRIKTVLNIIIEEPMERELISSFFYKTVESFEDGVNIKRFLEEIYLKFRGSRAGVDLKKGVPEYISKQEERIELLEETLNSIIDGFKFIRKVKDKNTGEEHIVFDL